MRLRFTSLTPIEEASRSPSLPSVVKTSGSTSPQSAARSSVRTASCQPGRAGSTEQTAARRFLVDHLYPIGLTTRGSIAVTAGSDSGGAAGLIARLLLPIL